MNEPEKSQDMPEELPLLIKPKESFRSMAIRFAITLAASIVLGLGSALITGWVMVHLLDNRVTILETKVQVQEPLTGKVDRLETTIERHEKALDRDFLRHEQIVAGLAVKTEDQEKRLTRVEALMDDVQATLKEIQMDVKTLLRGNGPMSFFKNQLEEEIHSVFLNLEEFGERGEISGHENVPMVVETLNLDPAIGGERGAVNYEGVLVHVSAQDVPDAFLAGRKTTFRHEPWFVLSSSCDEGLKSVQLYREIS